MTLPSLITERLTLRQMTTDDKADILALRSDPEINKYLDREASKTIDDSVHFINLVNDNIVSGKSLYWAITLTNNKNFTGTICLFNFSAEGDQCEIGYELLAKFHGQGIMQAAMGIVIEQASKIMKLKKIKACTHPDNKSSIKLLEKFGFERTKGSDQEQDLYVIYTLSGEK
jgi:RimJ/RimL family protein N-acetyltransferase